MKVIELDYQFPRLCRNADGQTVVIVGGLSVPRLLTKEQTDGLYRLIRGKIDRVPLANGRIVRWQKGDPGYEHALFFVTGEQEYWLLEPVQCDVKENWDSLIAPLDDLDVRSLRFEAHRRTERYRTLQTV